MTSKTLPFLIAILGAIVTACTALAAPDSPIHLSPAWACMVGAIGAVTYGAVRTIQKRMAGDSWKSILSTTEFWGMTYPALAALLGATYGLIPPGSAAGIGAFLLIALRVLRGLQTGLPVTPSAAPQMRPTSTPTPVTTPITMRRDGGYFVGSRSLVILGILGLLFSILAIVGPTLARADAPAQAAKPCPQLAICVGDFTIQPASAIAYQMNLKTGDYRQASAMIGLTGTTDALGIPLGLGAFCGSAFGEKISGASAAFQCAAGPVVTSWGALLLGFQTFKDPSTGNSVFQAVLSFAGTVTSGGTTAAFREVQTAAQAEK